ncbi:zinc finger CCCH domain-containing protein 13 [Dorcoceras hygrometricum]|uniref:Zinc finger CCCH domain-containing protein 13 n=1 Tax=Dorcoceras hygrometricum TaxID=472368 RepID=A0A2Z7AB70_9LAMI|nr:zinc finger CCCH domain-containing protein 13 [Dorcoceras hygrometricum]
MSPGNGPLPGTEHAIYFAMTIDDDSSIYVGGLPYDITEETLREAFYTYGAVLAVKHDDVAIMKSSDTSSIICACLIVNDHSSGGKCYGFVTFANPRSATQAIKEMDGKTIDGRVVKVNDVRTRGGRPNFNREGFRRDVQRGFASDRDRDHGRNDSHYRHSRRDGHRERSLDYDQDKERDQSQLRGHNRIKDRYLDEERFPDYNSHMDGGEQELERKREREWERDGGENIDEQTNNGHQKTGVKDKHQDPHLVNRSGFDNHANRDLSSEPFNDQDQISHMRGVAADQQVVVSELRAKCQTLEDSLITAKKLTSHRHQQLAKLHKCYLQVRDYDERLKSSELELQVSIHVYLSLSVHFSLSGGFGHCDVPCLF